MTDLPQHGSESFLPDDVEPIPESAMPPIPPNMVPPDDRDPTELEQRIVAYGDDPATAVEVVITGKHVGALGLLGAEPPCPHGQFFQDVVVADLKDEAGAHVAWRAQVKIKCSLCARDFTFTGETLVSADGLTIGALMEPTD